MQWSLLAGDYWTVFLWGNSEGGRFMKTLIAILFGVFFMNLTIYSFEKFGNIMLTFYGLTLCILGAIILSNRGITNGKIYTRILGIGISMILFGVLFILKPGDAGNNFGMLLIFLGSLFSVVDYVEIKGKRTAKISNY